MGGEGVGACYDYDVALELGACKGCGADTGGEDFGGDEFLVGEVAAAFGLDLVF